VVVTNKYGLKQDLQFYSKNIICKNLDIESLLEGLTEGVQLSSDLSLRTLNYNNNQIPREWEYTLAKSLQFINQKLFHV
jgi:hypothetical protein